MNLPSPPRQRRYMAGDATTEALVNLFRTDDEARADTRGKLLIVRDELMGLIGGFGRYSNGGGAGADRAFYLTSYNGGAYAYDRVGKPGAYAENVSICLIGGIQPGPMRRVQQEGDNDGLQQRIFYIVPGPSTEGEDRAPDDAAAARYFAIFRALAEMLPPYAANVTFAPEARPHVQRVFRTIEAHSHFPGASPGLKSALAKMAGGFVRVAIIFHLIGLADELAARRADPESFPFLLGDDPACMIVSEDTTRRAAAYVLEILLPHLLRAEAILFAGQGDSHARWIAGFILADEGIRAARRVTARDVQRAYSALRPPEQRRALENALAALETAGWVRPEPAAPGRPIAAWQVNPEIHNRFAGRARAERERRDAVREKIAADSRARSTTPTNTTSTEE